MYAHDHEWMDSAIGHPWGVGEKLKDVLVVRFHFNPSPLVGNSEAQGKWLHAMTLDEYSSLTTKEKKEFSNKFGTYVSMLHLKYGEVVGIQGWDVCFLPEDVLEFEVVQDLLSLAVSARY